MGMGRRRCLTDAEHDAYSKYWRKQYCYLQIPGVIAKIKRSTHKRERREGKVWANSE